MADSAPPDADFDSSSRAASPLPTCAPPLRISPVRRDTHNRSRRAAPVPGFPAEDRECAPAVPRDTHPTPYTQYRTGVPCLGRQPPAVLVPAAPRTLRTLRSPALCGGTGPQAGYACAYHIHPRWKAAFEHAPRYTGVMDGVWMWRMRSHSCTGGPRLSHPRGRRLPQGMSVVGMGNPACGPVPPQRAGLRTVRRTEGTR